MLAYLIFLIPFCFAKYLTPGNLSAALSKQFFHVNSSLPHFGLRETYTWKSLLSNITGLNENETRKIYRLIVVGRHGQGFHNVGESKHGRAEWNDKWSKLNGDTDLTWGPDANLTTLGKQQADDMHDRWKRESMSGLSWPVSKYSSPLSRTLMTAQRSLNITDSDEVMVLENLRETIGVHTCDKRSPQALIAQRFPFAHFESGFTGEDQLWKPDFRETDDMIQARATLAFGQIMQTECDLKYSESRSIHEHLDSSPVISVTTHSGFIRNLLEVLKHKPIEISTGGIVVLVVEAQCESLSNSSEASPGNSTNDADNETEVHPEQEDTKRIFLVQGFTNGRT